MKKHVLDAEEGEWIEVAPNTIHYDWCCDCNLRHIVEYRIVKNKSGKLTVERRS